MEIVEFFLVMVSLSVFNIGLACTDLIKELTFEHRIDNDEWREEHGYVRGLLGGWKKPKDRK